MKHFKYGVISFVTTIVSCMVALVIIDRVEEAREKRQEIIDDEEIADMADSLIFETEQYLETL